MTPEKLASLVKAFPARRVKNKDGSTSDFVMTMPVRLQWPALDEPKSAQEGQEPKYSACLLIPNGADISALNDIAAAAAKAKFGDDWAKKGIRKPFRSQNEKAQYDGFADSEAAKYVNASTKLPPALFGFGGPAEPLALDTPAIYAGCWVLAKINAYAYDQKGNKGVSFGLAALMKVADDDKLRTGNFDASNGFEAVPAHILAQGGVEAGGDPAELPGWD